MTDLQATLRDRFGAAVSPPLLDLHGRPRRTHTPEAVQAVCEIADSVLATGDAEIQRLRSYVDRYRIGLVGMSRRATRFRIAWRNARQRAARYRTETQQLRARVAELEQQAAIDTQVMAKGDADWNEARDAVQKWRAHAEQWQKWGEQHRDRADRYRYRLAKSEQGRCNLRGLLEHHRDQGSLGALRAAHNRLDRALRACARYRARVAELEAAEAAAEQRADRLAADLQAELDVNRRLFTQRQEMAAERYAWQERGDRAEARARALEAARDRVCALADRLADGTEAGFRTALAIRDALDGPARPGPQP